jgi:hypothetical protein
MWLPATCEDGSSPARGVEGVYECADGEPACANGAEPVTIGAGRPLCPAASAVRDAPDEPGCEAAVAPSRESASYSCEEGVDRGCDEDGSSSVSGDEEEPPPCSGAPGSPEPTLEVEDEDGHAGDDSSPRSSHVASAS